MGMLSLGSGILSSCLDISISSVYCEDKSDTSFLKKDWVWVKLGFGLSYALLFEVC